MMPRNWNEVLWGEEFDIQGGTQPPKAKFITEHKEGYVRLIQIRDFESDEYAVYVPDSGTLKKCDEQDIFIARYGASVGRILRGLSGAYNVALAKVLMNDKEFDRDFIYYFLNSSLFQKEIMRISARSAQSGFNKQDLYPLKVPKPILKEQHKIASILSSVDEAIEKTEAIIGQTETVKKGLMQQLLTKGIGHTKFKKTDIGVIPEEWNVTTLKSVAVKVTDGTHQSPKFTEKGIPFLLVSNIVKGFIKWETEKFISNETYLELTKNRQVEKGDILYSAVGSYGVAVVVDEDRKFSFQRHIAWIKPLGEKVESHYVAYVLNSNIGRKQADRVAVGNAQKTVTLDSLSKFLIPLPSLKEQKEIVSILWSVDKKLKIENEKLLSLKVIKKSLMESLLTGKVLVEVDEDEAIQV
ncbi:restriction endonuclease subunit S [Priestia megaterium]